MGFYQNYKWGLSTLHFFYRFKFICLVVVVVGGVAGELCYTLTATFVSHIIFHSQDILKFCIHNIFRLLNIKYVFVALDFFFWVCFTFEIWTLCNADYIEYIMVLFWMDDKDDNVRDDLSLFLSSSLSLWLCSRESQQVQYIRMLKRNHHTHQTNRPTTPIPIEIPRPFPHPSTRTHTTVSESSETPPNTRRPRRPQQWQAVLVCWWGGGGGGQWKDGTGGQNERNCIEVCRLVQGKTNETNSMGGPACWWGVCFFLLVSRLEQSGAHRRLQADVGCAERTMGTTLCLFECIFFEFQTSACTHTLRDKTP